MYGCYDGGFVVSKKFRIVPIERDGRTKYKVQERKWIFFWKDIGNYWKGKFGLFAFPCEYDAQYWIENLSGAKQKDGK